MLEIKYIHIQLGNFALQNINLQVEQGDYLTLLGLSGAGKTVLLEVLSGLLTPRKGSIWFEGKDITHQPIQQRPFGLVYQDMALFPHLSVQDNILYPMRCRRCPRSEMKHTLLKLARETGILHLLDRYPETLSGGESQRVALARTLAAEPHILLLDEPLASMDIKLKEELRSLLRQINQSGKTIIHVTHDYLEAASLSNKLAVIENGQLIQSGTPQEVFRKPASEFVARFSGIRNIFKCQVSPSPDNNGLSIAQTPQGQEIVFTGTNPNKETWVMIAGDDIIISSQELDTSAINQFHGIITACNPLAQGVEIVVRDKEEFSVNISKHSFLKLDLQEGLKVWISFKASSVKTIS